MSSSKRREAKKRRRQKRLDKRGQGVSFAPEVAGVLADLDRHLRVPMPATWPGGCDPSLARPDLVKAKFGEFVNNKPAAHGRMRQLENDVKKGPIGFVRKADHWAMEEFLWHGAGGYHPLDDFLASTPGQFPAAAADQLRLWKQARIGLFEIGPVANDTVAVQEWDPDRYVLIGPEFRAISLNIGGVNIFNDSEGLILLTYLAPWAPAQNIVCLMGYSTLFPKDEATPMLHYLALRQPEVACRPLPWNANAQATRDHRAQWRNRDWHRWLSERLVFPFEAYVITPEHTLEILEVEELLPSTPEEVRDFGIYFAVKTTDDDGAAGGTTVTPVDVASANRLALAEYHAYREWAGPPRRVRRGRGGLMFTEFDSE